jgi:energy-converting hydrogenase Eha subunit F
VRPITKVGIGDNYCRNIHTVVDNKILVMAFIVSHVVCRDPYSESRINSQYAKI